MPFMRPLLRAWSGEHLNAMLVRVVRQELRSRAFISVFTLLLAGATVAAMVVAVIAKNDVSDRIGAGFFGLLAWAWCFALGVSQPLACFRAISTERNDDTWDLLELTGIKPITVVRGLMMAALVQGLLYTSALAPFMVMAYLLRGIDLFAILFMLIIVPLSSILATSLAVFAASLTANKALRNSVGGLLGIGLVFLWLGTATLCFNLNELNWILRMFTRMNTEVITVCVGWLNAWTAAVTLCLVLAGTLLTHRALDRSLAPRLLWWGLWTNTWLWWPASALMISGFSADNASEVGLVLCILTICLTIVYGFFAISEDHEISPRQARAITAPPRWRRRLTWVLGPGHARGTLGFLAMGFLSMLLGALAWGFNGFTNHSYSHYQEVFLVAFGLLSWAAIIFAVGDAVARSVLANFLNSAVLRRGFFLLLTALWCLIPPLIAWLTLGKDIEDTWIMMISPVTCLIQLSDKDVGDAWGGFMAFCIVSGAAFIWLLRIGLDLKIETARVLARDDDRNPRGG